MERKLALITGLTVSLLLPAMASADDELLTQQTIVDTRYSERNFGLGAIVGDPTAVALKLRFDDRHALQLGVGWGFVEPYGSRVYTMLDYLWHFTLAYNETRNAGLLQPYVGVGGKLGFREGKNNAVTVGARVPLGMAFMLRAAPVEFFGEIAPGLMVVPDLRATVDGGIGARYYF